MTGGWLVSAPRLCGQPVLTPRGNCVGGQGLLPPPKRYGQLSVTQGSPYGRPAELPPAARKAVCFVHQGIALSAAGGWPCRPYAVRQSGLLPGITVLVAGFRYLRTGVAATPGCATRWFWSLGTTYWKHSRAAAPWPQGGVFCSPRNRLDCGRRVAVPRPRCAAIGV